MGFFFPKFLLTNHGDVLEYTVGVGSPPEEEPRNQLQEASPVLTAEIVGVS